MLNLLLETSCSYINGEKLFGTKLFLMTTMNVIKQIVRIGVISRPRTYMLFPSLLIAVLQCHNGPNINRFAVCHNLSPSMRVNAYVLCH